ncbi:hypothetical protein NHQ30_006364 [Ciborinia camelliae]|nr:hypothetical protein NHQ30_006364 [Ciborinia camelliae]
MVVYDKDDNDITIHVNVLLGFYEPCCACYPENSFGPWGLERESAQDFLSHIRIYGAAGFHSRRIKHDDGTAWRGLFPKPRRSFKPLSEIENWYDYHYTMALQYEIYKEIDQESLVVLPGRPSPVTGFNKYVYQHSTEVLSFILTIFAALEKALATSDSPLSQRTELEVHIMYPRSGEAWFLSDSDVILHLLPSLKTLRWVFVVRYQDHGSREETNVTVCNACTNRTIKTSSVYLEDYMRGTQKKDLAVVFNPTFAIDEETRDILDHLILESNDADFCTVFACDKEQTMMQETNYLTKLGAIFMVEGEENKWQSKRPIPSPLINGEHGFIYKNKYWWMIKRTDWLDFIKREYERELKDAMAISRLLNN